MASYATTPKWQRIAIWIIAIAMIIGTLAGFVFMIWSTQDKSIDPNKIAESRLNDEYQKQLEEYQKQQEEAQSKYKVSDEFNARVHSFDANSVKELTVDTLKDGDGATVKSGATIKVNYTGWTPEGKIFDSTYSQGADPAPVELSLNNVIEGWKEGLVGKKVGGAYELTIPANKAYGEQGSGNLIKANMPLKFIVEIINAS